MQKSDAARIIAGLTPAETKQSSAPTSVHVMSGEVVGNSESGKVQIRMDGDVVSPNDDQIIEIDALGGLEEGDTATILLTGQPGRAMTPMVMGSSGSVDRIVERIKTIEADYIKATEIEAEVATFGYLKASELETEVGKFGYLKANQLEAEVATFGYLKADDLEAEVAEFGYLKANSATITDLQADTAKIHNLSANDISAATGYIHDLTSGNVTAQNIIADHGDFSTVKANAAKVANLTAQELEADHATIANLDSSYAQIDMANVNNAWIANGLIKDAAIKSEMVESISANQLTAGEIDADEITVRNLKASSLTVQTADGYVYVGEKRIPTKEFIDSLKDELQNEIDGAIETFTVSAVPTLNNTPANEWVVSGDAEATRKLRAKHVGDIAYVVNSSSAQNGYCYRFAYDATAQEFKWVLIKDSDVTAALSRLSTAEGKITGLETFESNTTSWIEETDEGLETIRTNHTNLAGIVDKTVVETKQLWFTKANTTAPNKPTAAVTSTSTAGNAWRVVVPAWNASYPNYYYCLQYKLADGTYAWSDVVRDIAMGESQQQGRKGVANAATADGKAVSAQNTANANIKSSVQLWFTKANSTAPDKPSAQVTTNSASTTNAWNLAIPTYNSSYPHYFYCYQQQKGDGTYQWSDVVYDRSVTEAQAKAQAALPSSTFTTFQSTTFKNLVDTVDEQSSTITQLSNSVSSVGNILSGTVANPSNWIVSAPSGASYAKEAYGTAGVKVTFNSVSGFEWLYSQPIAVTSGNKYMVFFDYTVGKTYTTTSGKSGYGLVAYSGSNAPSGSFDDGNARFLGKAEFSKTASGDRVLKGSFTFTATSDSIILGLNGGQIADNQTRLSFTIDNLVVGDTLSTTSTTLNNVKQTADSNRTYLTNLTTTLGTNADGTSKSEDIVHKYNTLDQTLDGTVTRVGKTEASLKTVSNPNLTPYFSHKRDDVYNATSNNDGYWVQSSADGSPSYITAWDFEQTTSNGDGWAHLKANNTTNVTLYAHSYIHKDALNLKPSTEYTFLVEWLNITLSGTIAIFVTTEHGGTNNINDDFFITTVGTAITAGSGSKYLTATTRASLQSGSDKRIRTHVNVPVNASVDGYIRISLYEGKYDGPYKPYVDQSISSRVSQAETSIEQNTTDITLRATKTEAYQLSQPNLSPFFSMAPYRTSTSYNGGYWQPTADNWLMSGVTKLSDGWAHVTRGASTRLEVAIPRIESMSAGDKATLMVEWHNVTVTGSPKLYARNYPDNCQFNLNSYETTWNTSSATSGSRLIVMTVNSTATGDKTWNAAINLGMNNGSGVSFDGDLRISLYEGEYDGPYKPYVDQSLIERVSTAETSIEQTANNVLIKATKSDTTAAQGGQHLIQSLINVAPEGVKIAADKVNIEGAAIFTSGRLSSTSLNNAYDAKGSASTAESNAKAYTDSVEIGGRNLLLGTGASKTCPAISLNSNNYATYDYYALCYPYHELFAENDLLTLSFDWSCTATSGNFRIEAASGSPYTFGTVVSASGTRSSTMVYVDVTSTNTSGRVVIVFKATSATVSTGDNYKWFRIRTDGDGWSGKTFTVSNAKIERGNKVSDWSPAPEDQTAYVDSLTIGGRNLLLWTGSLKKGTSTGANSKDGISAWGSALSLLTETDDGIKLSASNNVNECFAVPLANNGSVGNGEKVLLTFEARGNITSVGQFFWIQASGSNIAKTSWLNGSSTISLSETNWTKFTVDVSNNNANVRICTKILFFYGLGSANSGKWVELRKKSVKLEKGDKATDWTPAPEDVDASIATAQSTANSAVKRSQRIYYRSSTDQPPTSMPTAWVTESGNKWAANRTTVANWTTKVTPISNGTGASVTKYLYLWTCLQYQLADDSAPQYTTVLLDDTTTVIDGGKIITGSLSANSINASSGTFDAANIPNLDASKINAGDIAAARIKTNVISAINSLTAGQINAARIKVSEISIGQSQVSGLSTALAGKETAGAAAAVQDNLDALSSGITWMGTCATAADAAEKVVVCEGFGTDDLKTGATICVRFASANTVANAITLNVNSTGAKTISAAQAVTSTTNHVLWSTGATIRFYYNGTNWRVADTQPSYYGTCGTAAGTAAKSASISGVVIFAGTTVNLNMSKNNTANKATLNVSSTGAKYIYYGTSSTTPTTSNGYGWHAAETAPFIFDGQFWRYVNSMTSYTAVQSAKTATNYIYASSDGIKIANASPSSATTYQHQTATGTDFVVAGAVRNRINGNGMTLYDGNGTADSNIVANFAANLVELGKGSTDAVIKFCNGMGDISYNANTKFLNLNSLRLSNYAKSNGTDMAASQIAAHFDSSAGENFANVLAEANSGYTRVMMSASYPVSGGDPMQASIEPYATGTEGYITFYANSFIFSGPGISGGGQAIKAIYADTTVVKLSNGKWLSLANATVVAQKLGSGASQTNTVCIAQNGGHESYTGVVTGAMGSDGSARAYIYPNHTGYIRINFILIRFA